MHARLLVCLALGLSTACSHPDAFAYTAPDVGPNGSGSEVLLTFNQTNYWPTLTDDGTGVLYSYVDESEATVRPIYFQELPPFAPSPLHIHRCMGEIPVAGGTRHWEYCDNGPTQLDSLNSFTAYAMDRGGRVLYAEATTTRRSYDDASHVALWLADSATPYRRTLLAVLPLTLGDSLINWIGDIKWTGASSFVALGQQMLLAGHCEGCVAIDTVLHGQLLIAGAINANGATLAAITGTSGAASFSLAEHGSSIVFTRRDSTVLYKVPLAGGVPSTIAVTPRPFMQLTGVSCRDATCVVALGPLNLWRSASEPAWPVGTGSFELRRVSLATGDATTVLARTAVMSCPLLTASGDVIAQLGNVFGHFQTFNAAGTNLRLYRGVVP